MSERYSKLFALSENLYSAGAPVVIAAGALQKDNQTGRVLAQLKMRNIQGKAIKAATVKITPFDTVGKPLGETVDYQYLDLSAGRDADFGQKTPVMLKEAATRSFTVSVVEVIFADNSVWTASNEVWEPLSAPVALETALSDGELAKQYRVKYGADCKCVFKKEKDLWRCACGAINHDSEKNCHSCQKEAAALAALNVDELKADRDKRLAAEQKKAADEKAAAAEQAKKTKKIAMIAAPIVVVAIIAAVLISNFVKARQEEAARSEAYNTAVAIAEAGQYDEAIAAFTELGDYKDSAEQTEHLKNSVEQIKKTAYNQAVTLFENGEFDEAYAAFEELGDYKDSETMRNLCGHGGAIVTIAFSRMGMFGDDSAETFDVAYHTQTETFLINLYFDKIVELTGCSPDETEGLKEELSYLLADMYDEVAACSGNYATITVYDTSSKKNIVFQI